jgi:L-threonylcarbamoyladenylate synthase
VARLRELVGRVDVLDAERHDAERLLPSPGLARKHYAPKARVVLVADPAELPAAAARAVADGERVAVLARAPIAAPKGVTVVPMPPEPEAYGAALYATLHDLDGSGVTWVLVEAPPQDERWLAVADRLRRAAD